jgi:hypothetical protein
MTHGDVHRALLSSTDEQASPQMYPRLAGVSTIGRNDAFCVRALEPVEPEYVTVPLSGDARTAHAAGAWNGQWEAAQFRCLVLAEELLTAPLRRLVDRTDVNVIFVPRTTSRYYEYAPLFHLLPRAALERHGLPLLRAGHWPFFLEQSDIDTCLPADFADRLARAWAGAVWSHLMPQPHSPLSGFTKDDPIRLLAHSLDFWIPPVTEVMQQTVRTFPPRFGGRPPRPPGSGSTRKGHGIVLAGPRASGDIWRGEQEAGEALRRTVETADADGRLRGILDAVRSHRCPDDFSSRWTTAREDFERKLYRKRSKVAVRFVELTDIIPVHGPEAEILDRLLCADFMALLDERDRTVVVLLHSGVSKLTEVAEIMGYSNHSAVSKRLDKIRRKAARFFDGLR